jgi:protocatechuate 4,5-dioxygenase beta chain
LQVKVDHWNPVFAGRDFAKESDKTHKPDVIFLIYNDHTTAFSLQGSSAG